MCVVSVVVIVVAAAAAARLFAFRPKGAVRIESCFSVTLSNKNRVVVVIVVDERAVWAVTECLEKRFWIVVPLFPDRPRRQLDHRNKRRKRGCAALLHCLFSRASSCQ